MKTRSNTYLVLVVFVILVMGSGWMIGLIARPGEWYEALNKPSFNPPNWVFAPAWTLLYMLIAFVGWRLWLRREMELLTLWGAQLILNFAWSPVFFLANRVGLALAILSVLLLVVLSLAYFCRNRDRVAAIALLPYALWLAFAWLLNAAIYRLN